MKGPQRFLGYALVGIGAAGFLIGASPLFPVFIEAFVVGGALIAAGLWILAGPELRASIAKAVRLKTRPSSRARRPPAPRVVTDPLLPVRVLRLAKDHAGILTVADVAMELSIPLDQAEAGLSECVRAGNALPDFDVRRGHAYYRFPEFIEGDEGPGSG